MTQEFVQSLNCASAECNLVGQKTSTLTNLGQKEIDNVAQFVPGGARNVQDIYPLAPVQEGILFHRLLSLKGDAYVLSTVFEFQSREQLTLMIAGLQKVIDRHDILRSSVFWDAEPQPFQVVHRHALLPVEELPLEMDGSPIVQLQRQMRPEVRDIDLRSAPLMRLLVATDARREKWYGLLKIHHLLCDHQAWGTVVSEAMECVKGRERELPAPQAYREYVEWALSQARTQEAELFFREKLRGFEEPTAPFGLMDVHGDGSRIDEARHILPPQLASRVRAEAKRAGVGPSRLFHAAWGLVVAHTCGRNDVVFGTVVLAARRRAAQAQRMLGMFVNTLPLRLQLDGRTAREFLEHASRELEELLVYEQTSAVIARRCSGIVGTAPLFTAVLNYRYSVGHSVVDARKDECKGSPGIRVLMHQYRTTYPVGITVDDLGDGFALIAQSDQPVDPNRLIGYLQTALESLVYALEYAPATPAFTLAILPEAEWQEVVKEFNRTAFPRPRDVLIPQLFEKQVRGDPDAIAVVHGRCSCTYRELNARANQLAWYLKALGVGPDRLVALCLERSLDMLVGLLGVLKAGGAYVPLDPSNPRERLEYILADARPTVILTHAVMVNTLPRAVSETILLDADWNEIAKQSNEDPCRSFFPENLAYVIYTSGSTGRPKGVMVEHRNIANYAFHAIEQFDVRSGDGSILCTSVSFDLLLTGLYPTLLCGRTVRLCPEQGGFPLVAAELLRAQNLAPLKLTPAHLALLEDALRSGALTGRIRVLVLGGEPLQAAVVQLWWKFAPGTRIFNHYGPTEATVGCVVNEIFEGVAGAIPIGRPISNAQVYILDARLQPVPIGVVGEIYIGGAGVARGYLNLPELTAERFIKNPFVNDSESRLYKTGDLGRWCSDGRILFLGRRDHQVKIRGFRVELGEIEAHLVAHAQVKEAVVLARDDVSGVARVVAYVVGDRNAAEHVAGARDNRSRQRLIPELRKYLKEQLPDYMIPSAWVVLEKLPLTANGKIDRRALPNPEERSDGVGEYVPAQTELERVIADIWAQVLQIDLVGIRDNFFDLGGHSLTAMRLTGGIARRLAVELPVQEVFRNPTVQQMAQYIRQLSEGTPISVSDQASFEERVI